MLSKVNATASGKPDTLASLQREVTQLFEKHKYDLPQVPPQEVELGFLINAQNEIIITDVRGDSDAACAFVKEVLNYKKLKFNNGRQLTRYAIKIHLLKD